MSNNHFKTKILSAIVEDPEIVLLLKERYVDEEVWKFCIEREPGLFRKMKHPSEEICRFACEIDGSNLKYLLTRFRYVPITDSLCFLSVRSNAKAILYVPNKFLNMDLMKMAFDKDPSLMKHFRNIDPDYIRKTIEEKPYTIGYLDSVNEDLVCEALKKNPNLCAYISHWSDRMLQILEQDHPAYYTLYMNSIVAHEGATQEGDNGSCQQNANQ